MLMAEMAVPVSEAVRTVRVSTYLSTAVMFTHMPMMILKVMRQVSEAVQAVHLEQAAEAEMSL